jgi:iron complex outermembrane recepter protein
MPRNSVGRIFLASTVAASTLVATVPALAQETAAVDDVIVVTGSRIARPEADSANPIVAITGEALIEGGTTNVTDYLLRSPALIASTGNIQASGSNAGGLGDTGVNLLNLRNLGTNRTLVLVNGRRHVAGLPETAAVDINSIPQDLIERIDVLTGGASAIYGADGVSGVVNFILKRNYEGLGARAQFGISDKGDGSTRFGSIIAGKNFADDRGNITLAYEYNRQARLDSFSRDYIGDPIANFGLIRNPADFPDTLSVFDRVLINDLRWADSSANGALDLIEDADGNSDGASDFQGTGALYDRGQNLRGSGGRTRGGSGTPIAGYFGDLIPQTTRHAVNALFSFEFSPALRLFAEGKYVNNQAFSVGQPSFDFGTFIAADNPFLPANVAAVAPFGLYFNRDNYDLGLRGERNTRETLRGVIGVEGAITDNARYELSYNYGETRAKTFTTSQRIGDRYFAALDAVRAPNGQIVCRSTLDPTAAADATTFTPGANSPCRPLNLFGENVASQAALDFVLDDTLSFSKVTQQVVSGSVSGDFGAVFTLPGGPIGFAFGGEYRRETSSTNPDPLIVAGALADFSAIAPTTGKFDVKEGFAELSVPLLRDLPFAHLLSVGAAIRYSDYSTIGSTTTWKVDGVYAPIRDLRVRGTYSKAVRAPNIGELFGARSGTFEFIDDPCDPTNIGEGTSFRVANCNATLTAAGLSTAQIANFSPTTDPEASTSRPGFSGGNPLLNEERATTWTAGVVLQPRFLPGFTATFDWYDIKLEGAINTADAQDIVDLCVDQPTLNNQFCANVTREQNTGFVTSFLVGPQNVAEFRTAGADVTLNYRFEPGPLGVFNVGVVVGYLNKLTFVPSIGAEVDDDYQEAYAPKWQATATVAWKRKNFGLTYNLTWFDKTRRFTTEQLRANPDISDPRFFFFKQRWEHDVRAAVDVGDRLNLYAGVNNVFNQKPDVGVNDYPISALGRFLYVGARIKLDRLF